VTGEDDNRRPANDVVWVGAAEKDPYYQHAGSTASVLSCETLYDALAEFVAGRSCPAVVVNIRTTGPRLVRFWHYLSRVRRIAGAVLYSMPAGGTFEKYSSGPGLKTVWADTPADLQAALAQMLTHTPAEGTATGVDLESGNEPPARGQDRAGSHATGQAARWPDHAPAEPQLKTRKAVQRTGSSDIETDRGESSVPRDGDKTSADGFNAATVTDEELRALLGPEYSEDG